MKSIIKSVLLGMTFSSMTLLSGCAALSGVYPAKMKQTQNDLADGHIQAAKTSFIKEMGEKSDSSLYDLELARIQQLDGQYQSSKQNYAKVINTIATSQMEAKVRVSSMLENIGAVLTNDKSLPYSIPDYAMTYLYPYQALNYLAEDDLSGALVAIRQLSNAQYWVYEQKLMAGDLDKKYSKETKKSGIDRDKLGLDKSEKIKSMFAMSHKITNSWENGFALYLSAILYEAFDNNYNNAFVSIKKAKNLLPDNPYVAKTYEEMENGFNGGSALKAGYGRLVILYEQGYVTAKQAFKLPLYLGSLGLQEVAVPYYPSKYRLLPPIDIDIESNGAKISSAKSAILVNSTLMAAKSLTEEYPVIITREVIRLLTKSLATYEATQQAGLLGNIAGSVYSFITAEADQRSWLLLPNNIQLYETQLPTGDINISIAGRKSITTKIIQGHTTLIWVVNIDRFNKVYNLQL
ncbi:MAG: COG3014 family protein [Francisellaceae bacterium]